MNKGGCGGKNRRLKKVWKEQKTKLKGEKEEISKCSQELENRVTEIGGSTRRRVGGDSCRRWKEGRREVCGG